MLALTSNTTLFIVPDNRREGMKVKAQGWDWVYLHGTLEDAEGYDIVALLGCNPEWVKDGIYNAVVNGHKEKNCRVYYWSEGAYNWSGEGGKTWVAPMFHGLIVDESDGEGVKYAEEAYKAKKSHL